MIKKLQYKFVLIIMSILLLVIVLIVGALNIFTYKIGEYQSKNFMISLANFDGDIGMAQNSRMPFSFTIPNSRPPVLPRNFFTIKLNSYNEIIEILYSKVTPNSEEELDSMITTALKKDKSFGMIDNYRFMIKEKPYGKIIIFVDNSAEINLCYRLLTISIVIGSVSLFILFFISLFLSRMAVRPVQEAFEKQKQFISDASHELKTPISIINVNADVLESNIGTNKWLNYIKSETARMSSLVNQLLNIARLDSANHTLIFSEFSLSEAVMQMVLPFESTAYESGKTYAYEIEENLSYVGDVESIKQLLAILIDNALKNTFPKGEVKISLKKLSSKLILEVFNTGNGIEEDEKDKIFERFYCSDTSRARATGGYGLGLSIAKSIVILHHGKISVQSQKGEWAKFTVVL